MKILFPLALAAFLITIAFGAFDYWVFGVARIAVSAAAFGYGVSFESRSKGFMWVLFWVAIIFNPIVPLHLGRAIWQWVDVAAAVVFISCAFLNSPLFPWFVRRRQGFKELGVVAVFFLPVIGLFYMASQEEKSEKVSGKPVEVAPLPSYFLSSEIEREQYESAQWMRNEIERQTREEMRTFNRPVTPDEGTEEH